MTPRDPSTWRLDERVRRASAGQPKRHKTMVKALARAFRWRQLIERGVTATVAEIAAAEKINPSYVSRILRLTLLAPDIVEMILDGRQPADLTLAKLMSPFPAAWAAQGRRFGIERLR